MFDPVRVALRRIQKDLAEVLDARQITAVCREVGYRFRQRLLDPIATIQLFVVQILHGNFAVAQLQDFTDEPFSEAAYCKARGRLPLAVLQTLLQRVGAALRTTLDDAGRWCGHRTFHIDGSAFSMPDTPELQKEFGQPGGQRVGCGFPVAHMLTLFHAGTGFLLKVLTAPLRTHDMAQAALLHPQLEEGDVLIGDRAFSSYAPSGLASATKVARRLSDASKANRRFPFLTALITGPARNPRRDGPPRVGCSDWASTINSSSTSSLRAASRPAWMAAEDYEALPAVAPGA